MINMATNKRYSTWSNGVALLRKISNPWIPQASHMCLQYMLIRLVNDLDKGGIKL